MTEIIWHASPNFGERRGNVLPDMVVLHYTAMESAEAAIERLCAPEFEVSCHYVIGRDGTCWQLVDEAHRAWHAGAGSWQGRADVNSHSIGVELDNDGVSPFSEPQMAALESLLPDILKRWSIPAQRVIGHSDMAPGRKNDPGPRFDWARLERRGLAGHAENVETGGSAPVDEARFRAALQRVGYPVDGATEHLLSAFRNRFRPWGSGALAPEDMHAALQAERSLAVDPPLGAA